MPVPKGLETSDKYKVLVVDDDPDELEFITTVLSQDKEALQVETAEDGYIACMKIGSFKPDLVILDLVMRKVDGMQVVRQLRGNEETKNIEIIILTGHSEKVQEGELKKLGVRRILHKPVTAEQIREVVQKALKID